MQGLRMSLRSLLFKSRAEKEMDQELKFHIEMQTALNLGKGMTPEQARTEALRAEAEVLEELLHPASAAHFAALLLELLHAAELGSPPWVASSKRKSATANSFADATRRFGVLLRAFCLSAMSFVAATWIFPSLLDPFLTRNNA